MNTSRQIGAITAMNLRMIPARLGTSLVICIGIAGVVAVLIAVLAMGTGLEKTIASSAKEDRVIVFRSGAQAEALSSLTQDGMLAIETAPGIARTPEGKPAVSPEVLMAVNLPRRSNGELIAASVRGITSTALAVRPEIQLTSGRMFTPGLRELVVGQTMPDTFRDLSLGDRPSFLGGEWIVVGTFSSNGDAHESEMLTDATTLMSAGQRTVYNAATVQLESPDRFDEFKAAATSNPNLKVDVQREVDYYTAQATGIATLLKVVANVIGTIMATGALFGALNTMYSAVSARTVEISTLRAIGFGSTAVVVSVLAEALVLALIGALAGAALAWLFFNGNAVTTGGVLTQVTLQLDVSAPLIITGMIWAIAIGLIGGLFPAVRAARQPVAIGLRV
jgi:putative ABC transport system permease protein